ncbi:ABC transporter ATP-binding protein [Sphingosinicella microcystinivorans]|uniref:Spermidine/putrescine import ATP-binding protein PotA n=1 Tax=Sphingosinicella microcystinivorans TaxID=335406 RepID=A0AAD1D7K3_SPHMI|nr:ABC transporter ATP-binding protein [Sphingosinicella microcystinivorans]RKS86546.1 spermidine/putrescine transport system ATP-binding protein/putrescine transport system ATP-binding protein [Sphingosinicella microcystinivorans]BBE35347.1 polyamine-transporting ATPase [Sphingosinicella microcystinivorans]
MATAPKQPIISIQNITKRFGAVAAVDNVSLDIMPGEFFVLLGPSGCGKTTLLRMIAGFEVPTEGRIIIDGQDMAHVPPNKRPVNMVFQSYAVFPHMTVTENVGYGLRIARVPSSEIKSRVEEALALVKLDGFGARRPDQLSGGQRQRVALARSLVMRPKVLLLDEPLSALDAKLRAAMQFELADLQEQVGITFVTVTHDQDEALSMAGRIAVINRGLVAQLATPSDLYEFPTNRFVADFIGSVNLFDGRLVVDEPDRAVVDSPEIGRIYLNHGVTGPHDANIHVALRPEKIAMIPEAKGKPSAPECPEGDNIAHGQIRGMSYLGDITIYEVKLDSGRVIRVSRPNLSRYDQEDFTWDDKVWLSWHGSSPVVLLS